MATECKQKTMIQIAKISARKNNELNTKRNKAKEKGIRNLPLEIAATNNRLLVQYTRAANYGGIAVAAQKKKGASRASHSH